MTKYLFIAALLMSNFSYANSDASKCAKIISDKERLSCYDLVFKDTSDLITEKKALSLPASSVECFSINS